jgi:transcriptional antiterminator
MSNRNEARWTTQEIGEMDYDSKSMMHCFRLLEDAKHIAEEGRPLVEFKDDGRDFLMNVRAGHYSYDDLMETLNDKLERLKDIFDKSSIRKTCDMKKVNELYKTLMRMD